MLSQPLMTTLNKNKIIMVRNGEVVVKDSPVVEAIIPKGSQDKIFKNVNTSFSSDVPDHLFIGLNKFTENDVGVVFESNAILPALKAKLDHSMWRESLGRKVPYSYTDYMLLTQHKYLSEFKHSNDLKLMYFDIETCSDGTGIFPTAERNPIAMIGYQMSNSDEIKIIDNFNIDKKGEEDKELLESFNQAIIKENPDIIVSFNGWKFDMPYILKRLKLMAMRPDTILGITKEDAKKYQALNSHYIHSMDPDTNSPGILGRRLHYDIFHVDVLRDQKLTGKVKDRKMKTLAKFFFGDDGVVELEEGIENIWEMMASEKGKAQLREYLNSDIVQTRRLSEIYFKPNNVDQANKLNVPLSTIITRRNGTIPTLYLMRKMLDRHQIPWSANNDTFQYLEQRAAIEYKEEKFFQGAFVGMYKKGKIPKKVIKVDFKSLYPNIIRTLNLSYENVKFKVELKDIKNQIGEISDPTNDSVDNYEFKKIGDELHISYDDKVLHIRATVIINQSKRALVPEILDEVLGQRAAAKKKMDGVSPGSIEHKALDSEQNFYKVIANSIYGVISQRTGIGFLPVGMTITAMGRWSTKSVVIELNREGTPLLEKNKFASSW